MSSTPCPHCGALLTPAATQEGRCNVCRGDLPSGIQVEPPPGSEARPAPSPFPAPADAIQSEAPPLRQELDTRLSSIRKGGDWTGVHAGLGLLVVGLSIYLACQVIEVLPRLMVVPPALREGVGCLTSLTALGNLAAAIILLVGMIRTALPPQDSGFRPLGVSSLVCSLVGVALPIGILGLLLADRFAVPARLEPVTLLAPLIGSCVLIFVGSLLFFIYLRAVACYFGNRSLGNAFIGYFVGSIVVFVGLVGFLYFVVPAQVLDLQGRVFMLLVFGLVLMFWVISLYNQLRNLIGKGGEKRPTLPE